MASVRDRTDTSDLWFGEAEAPPLPFVDMSNWDNEPLPDREWAVRDRIPLRQTSLISGEGGAGKSNVTLHLCVAHALARDWLLSVPEPGSSIFMDAEDTEAEIHIRLGDILKYYGLTYAEAVKGGFHLLSFAGKDAVLATASRNGKVEPTALYSKLLQAAGDIKPKMIGIASAANVFAGNESDRAQVQFVGLLTRIAIFSNGSVKLVTHPSLTGIASDTGLSGSTQWHNAVRARCYLKSIKPENRANNPRTTCASLCLRKINMAQCLTASSSDTGMACSCPSRRVTSLSKLAQAVTAQGVFLTLLKRFEASNRTVGDKSSRSYDHRFLPGKMRPRRQGLTASSWRPP